jgi:pimeloyl-ACP methyl ester carboxylesterase
MAFVRHAIDINGCKLSFVRAGKGAPLLYLHGTDGLAEWPAILDTLAERFDVIVPDHPGFGASEAPAWIDDVSDVAYCYLDAIEALPPTFTWSDNRSAAGSRSRWRCARPIGCAA